MCCLPACLAASRRDEAGQVQRVTVDGMEREMKVKFLRVRRTGWLWCTADAWEGMKRLQKLSTTCVAADTAAAALVAVAAAILLLPPLYCRCCACSCCSHCSAPAAVFAPAAAAAEVAAALLPVSVRGRLSITRNALPSHHPAGAVQPHPGQAAVSGPGGPHPARTCAHPQVPRPVGWASGLLGVGDGALCCGLQGEPREWAAEEAAAANGAAVRQHRHGLSVQPSFSLAAAACLPCLL